jgi:antirestriction protein ArdC
MTSHLAAHGNIARLGVLSLGKYASRWSKQILQNHQPQEHYMQNRTFDLITQRILTMLEHGTIPWRKPWHTRTGWPRNYISKKQYRGINAFLLAAMGYESPLWLTFRQAAHAKGCVRKGEKACPVVFWKRIPVEDKASGEEKRIPLLRFYYVFNTAQCDGLGDMTASVALPDGDSTAPEDVVAHMPHPPAIKHGMTHAFYSPSDDCIGLPMRARFTTPESYYATLFHELIHATGHEKRLARPALTTRAGFGSNPYCKEELIAEMGAAFLCGHAGIVEQTVENSAAYLHTWKQRLQEDNTLIVQAAAQAQKAVDFILGRTFPESEDGHE